MNGDIKTYRLTHGLSQREMAKKLGLAKSTVCMIENGSRKLPDEARVLFASLLEAGKRLLTQEHKSVEEEFNLNELKEYFISSSRTKLEEKQMHCELALHKYEVNMQQWKKQYQRAMSALMLAKNKMAFSPPKPGPESQMRKYTTAESEYVEAHKMLRQIITRRPVLVMAKMEGLKAELAAIKNILEQREEGMGLLGWEF